MAARRAPGTARGEPESHVLLAFFSSALALTVPLRVTYSEEVSPGETTVASSALTADVKLFNPTTQKAFIVDQDELTVNKREASGQGGLTFAGNPAGSVRTWAVYLLDVNGKELGDPEIVDVLFDANGNGAIAARDGAGNTSRLSVDLSEVLETGWKTKAKVEVADAGTLASYIGITELTNDGKESNLRADPDMDILDANTFAAYQGLGLDAIIVLDKYKAQLEGNLTVTGLAQAADGTIESGANLQWDLTFYDAEVVTNCTKTGTCKTAALAAGTASYSSAIAAVKKQKTETPRVVLKPADQTYDIWDSGFTFSVEGDVRDLELVASLNVYSGDKLLQGADVISLDPGGFGAKVGPDLDDPGDDDGDDDGTPIVDIFIDGDCDDCGDYDYSVPNPTNPPPWTVIANTLIDIDVVDSGGQTVATHQCTLWPTAKTQAGTGKTPTLLGECTRDVAGTEVRRLQAQVGPKGGSSWSVEMAGPALAETSAATCDKEGACTDGDSVVGGTIELSVNGTTFFSKALAVTSTQFDMPFTFASDVDGLTAQLLVDLEDGNQIVAWTEKDGILYGTVEGKPVYAIDTDSIALEQYGIFKLSDGSFSFAGANGVKGPVTGTYSSEGSSSTGIRRDGG